MDFEILGSSFLTVFEVDFVAGTSKVMIALEAPDCQVEGYFTENPSSSFLYSESLSETFVVSLTGAEDDSGSVDVSPGVVGVVALLPPKYHTAAPRITRTIIIVIDFFIVYLMIFNDYPNTQYLMYMPCSISHDTTVLQASCMLL